MKSTGIPTLKLTTWQIFFGRFINLRKKTDVIYVRIYDLLLGARKKSIENGLQSHSGNLSSENYL